MILSLQRDAFSCKASLSRKQFTGLFSEFTLAMRLRIISLFFKNWEQRPETLSLDSAKGTQSLWNPIPRCSFLQNTCSAFAVAEINTFTTKIFSAAVAVYEIV
jgi:hypothetical protein